MTVGYTTLANWYTLNFQLRQHHKYTDQDILEWYPYERDIYVSMLVRFLEAEKQRMEQQNK